ncbi:YecA family protein [Salinispira pacifica]
MASWRREFENGKRALARHNPRAALACFNRSLRGCPDGATASKVTYYRGLALYKLRCPGMAMASWVEAQRYRKSGFPRKMLDRFSNEYGMPKRETEADDDRHAFFALQLSRYLENKPSHRLDTRAEGDVIRELIDEYWQSLLRSGILEEKNTEQKFQLFRSIVIVFPYFTVPDRFDDRLVHVDFEEKRRIGPEDRCPCRSGLPFKQCCGRIPAEDELLAGGF